MKMFTFDAKNIITKKDYCEFIEAEKINFETQKNILFQSYDIASKVSWSDECDEYEKFRNDYNDLVHAVLINAIYKFRSFLPKKCLIKEFGSFVKGTERILSDFDFTICYDEPKVEKHEVAEELIDYSLAAIFNYRIDQIHGKFQHYPPMPEVLRYTEEDNNYRILFEDGHIDYKCGPETLHENLMHIKNVRDYASMMEGYQEKYDNKCDIDCLYSIRIIENTTEHDLIRDLAKMEMDNNIFEGYEFNYIEYEPQNKYVISNLKKMLKEKGITEFYIYLSYLRNRIKFNNSYSMNLNDFWQNKIAIDFFGEKYISALKSCYLEFLFYFNRLELSLNDLNVSLSTKNYDSITGEELNAILNSDWGMDTTIEAVINSRNKLSKNIEVGLIMVADKNAI